ncbi:MAG: putative CobE protein [Rhodospirillales bacterium]|nr:putative CobE protein [Rhodospirillales bacterium]
MSAIAIGVGCRKGCPADTIESLVRQALDRVATTTPLGLFTLVDKSDEIGLSEAAGRLGLDLIYLSREALGAREDGVQTRSPLAESLFGVPSVAEAAALAGAGPRSVLIVPRIAEGGATCAIAGTAS